MFTHEEQKFFLSHNGHALPPLPIKVIPQGFKELQEYDIDNFERIMGVRYLSHLRFENEETLKTVASNCPLLLRFTSLGEVASEIGNSYREEISTGYLPDLTIQWTDSEMGYGVFTNEDLLEGEYIGEYTGLVRRLYRNQPDHNAYCFQYPTRFWNWNLFVIDAALEGNTLRYLNHSDTPNLQPAWALERNLMHMVLFANQNIPKGTQLTFDYGPDYWQLRKKA